MLPLMENIFQFICVTGQLQNNLMRRNVSQAIPESKEDLIVTIEQNHQSRTYKLDTLGDYLTKDSKSKRNTKPPNHKSSKNINKK